MQNLTGYFLYSQIKINESKSFKSKIYEFKDLPKIYYKWNRILDRKSSVTFYYLPEGENCIFYWNYDSIYDEEFVATNEEEEN